VLATMAKSVNNLSNMLEVEIPNMRGKDYTVKRIKNIFKVAYDKSPIIEDRHWGIICESDKIRVSIEFYKNGHIKNHSIRIYE
jgi:hypothetical protein